MLFRARQSEFTFPRPALVMGIVNVTPDSFSDGGQFFDPAQAVAHALKLVAQGAEILDIGGESTRPNAEPVSEAEELRRVIPVIEQLAAQTKIPLSIDTMKPAVARAALQAGASIVNDVAAAQRAPVWSSAFRRSEATVAPNRLKAELQTDEMWRVVAEFHAGYICMHAASSGAGILPASLRGQAGSPPHSQDIVREVVEFFQERLQRLNACGITADQVVFDVGIGFGKTLAQNLSLLASQPQFTKLGRPLLLGVSRKSFIGKLLGANVDERLPASLACASLAVADGVQIIRTHDVAETVQAVRMTEAILVQAKK
jgi:dihydropteroate synthase